MARMTVWASPLGTRRMRSRPDLRWASVTIRASPLPTTVSPSQSPIHWRVTTIAGCSAMRSPDALTLSWRAATMATALLAKSQIWPRRFATLTVDGDVLIDALAADRRRRASQLRADLAGRKTAAMQMLNLIAFDLGQVCIAHVQFHLPVKLHTLPRPRRSTALGGALQN